MTAIPSQTEKGVRSLSNAMLVWIAFNATLLVLLFAASSLIAQVATLDPVAPDPSVIQSVGASLLGFLAAVCAVLAIALVALGIGLLGVIAVRRGAGEFGPDHAHRVDRATVVLILGIVIPLVGSVLVPTSAFGLGDIGDIFPTFDVTVTAASAAISTVGTILIGLFLLWSAESFFTPRERQRGLTAIVIGVVGVTLGGVAGLVVLSTVPLPTNPQNFDAIFLVSGAISSGISILSITLWYTAYRGVLERFRRGELRPASPLASAQWAPPYPQGYWPPAQPVEPPAQSPPEPPLTPGP